MVRNNQAEAAAKYGEELRTESQQASSFIYHLKRFNNWVKATVRVRTGVCPFDCRCLTFVYLLSV